MNWICSVTTLAGLTFQVAHTIDESSPGRSSPAAAEGHEEPHALTPAERLKALVEEYEAARQDYLKATDDGDVINTPPDQFNEARQKIFRQEEKSAAGWRRILRR